MWVRVWLCANETRTVGRPGSWAPDNPFTFLLPCTGAEEIVPISTRGKRGVKGGRKIMKKKPAKTKKKSGNLMKRAQKKFERDRRKIFFLRVKPYAVSESKKSRTFKVRGLIIGL